MPLAKMACFDTGVGFIKPAASSNTGVFSNMGLGFSYGSVLGETVAAMFPNRMDKVILDGVVNGHNYYHKTGM